jgi:hypothetical protein
MEGRQSTRTDGGPARLAARLQRAILLALRALLISVAPELGRAATETYVGGMTTLCILHTRHGLEDATVTWQGFESNVSLPPIPSISLYVGVIDRHESSHKIGRSASASSTLTERKEGRKVSNGSEDSSETPEGVEQVGPIHYDVS